MNKTKNLLHVLLGKAALAAVLPVLFFAAFTPAFAQTADARYAGVFYKDNPTTNDEMYCDYLDYTGNADESKFKTASMEPTAWGNSSNTQGMRFKDGDYYVEITDPPNTTSCGGTSRTGNTHYSLGTKLQTSFIVFDTQTGQMTTYYACGVLYSGEMPGGVTIEIGPQVPDARSFRFSPAPTNAHNNTDPWVSSALIEYDQPYPNVTPADNKYPNHCLALCMNAYCQNKPLGGSTYSISFPLQQVKFDVVKYYNNKNIENPEEAPAIRTIDLYPASYAARCGSYRCPGGPKSGFTCHGAKYYCTEPTDGGDGSSGSPFTAQCGSQSGNPGACYKFSDGSQTEKESDCHCSGGSCNFAIWQNNGVSSNDNDAIPFCAAWDGSYEIAGEFGKTNGNFGFRATVKTDVPGDNIITDKISFDSTIAYPGMNQIPIQVDVTNIHTVRSTPSVVGNITSVSAQPYTYSYRLSKDSDVRIAIFDASTDNDIGYTHGDATPGQVVNFYSCDNIDLTIPQANCPSLYWNTYYADIEAYRNNQAVTGCCVGTPEEKTGVLPGTNDIAVGDLVRTLVDWKPRLGEGMKGVEKDVQITEFDSWDGRGNNGLFLPAGNYIVSLQAKTQDEWPGVDFSRAVTRQLSLDPLKLTDVMAVGLTKQSTAYASITYTPTESSKVYWYIYTPGTTVDNVDTNSALPTGTQPQITGGTLVAKIEEDRVGRMNFTSKWDGLCGMDGTEPLFMPWNGVFPDNATDSQGTPIAGNTCAEMEDGGCTYYLSGCIRKYAQGERRPDGRVCAQPTGCTEKFAYGAPMPDGNYIYALWAEIPYNGCYYNKSSNWTDGTNKAPYFVSGNKCYDAGGHDIGVGNNVNGKAFTGVKTLKYTTGQIAVERGVVDITIQPVSYSTVGSSPTAYGLDPFIFKYSVARDSTVVAKVTNSAGVDVKYLTPKEGVTQVAQQMNTISWDGRDDAGRMITPGTYMFVVETKDAMFPAVTNRASAVFPVDMYRLVDLATTDVYGDSNAKATLSYSLSKAMNVQVNIYNKDVVIPNYQTSTGEYGSSTVTSAANGTGYAARVGDPVLNDNTIQTDVILSDTSIFNGTADTATVLDTATPPAYRDIITVGYNPSYDGSSTTCNPSAPETCNYRVTILREYLDISASGAAAWPPRICNTTDDAAVFTNGYVDPALNPQCIYVNDTNFTNYPASADAVASGVVDVRLQPVKTFERSSMKPGDGLRLTEEWDALYFYNPSKCAAGSTNLVDCPYEMVPDGQYPFYVSARSNEAFNRYYAHSTEQIPGTTQNYIEGAPFKTADEIKQEPFLYATDKVTSKINVTRGSVYFLDGSTVVYPNAPQLFNVSSGPVFVPPYEINFSVSRAATVEVAVVALAPNVCNPDPTVHQDLKNNRAGDVCKYLSTMTIVNTGHFDPNIIRKTYWDGTDNNGFYVKPGQYEIRLTAKNYPDPGLYQPTVKSIPVNADLMKVFDLLEADGYAISQRGTDMKIGYQVSVPMKVGIQILKPGTTIYDYQKGTLRNPTTGQEVQDIRDVLVRAITGIRPATTLIEEVWDGKDYAGQDVPDGTYPFRFVTAIHTADIDSVTGEITGVWADTDGSTDPADWKINRVADTYEYQNLHKATVAIGDGRFVCEDWEKTVFFYPNPLTDASRGTLEITKMPVPGEVSIKYFNLAGDLVRDSDYTCVDANNYQVTMGSSLSFNPDNTPADSLPMDATALQDFPNVRNAAMRCRWDRTNQHGKKVARGVYFGLVDFKAKMGREHCQKVVKILIP